MRYANVEVDGAAVPVVVLEDRLVPLSVLARAAGTELPGGMEDLIAAGDAAVRTAFGRWRERGAPEDGTIPLAGARFLPPYARPGKLWGIGLNYRDHAADLDEAVPSQPASFLRPVTSVIGPGVPIELPAASERVTAEAELGLVVGKRLRDADASSAAVAVFGYTMILDMTAEDILRLNPRFLTRAKSFDTFFSFGPWIATPEEVEDVLALEVTTRLNGEAKRSNVVRNMTYKPFELLAFHSRGMTWEPGDILSTGTPGAVVVEDGDVVACSIGGLGTLENPVVRRG